MTAKPKETLELHYPMIQFLISINISLRKWTGKLPSREDMAGSMLFLSGNNEHGDDEKHDEKIKRLTLCYY